MNSLEDHIISPNYPSKFMDGLGLYEESSNVQFEKLLNLACFVSNCEAAYISLIEEGWQNIRYTKGTYSPSQLFLYDSICSIPVSLKRSVQIEDITENTQSLRFFDIDNFPFHGFAGFPLITKKGYVLGTLCVLSSESKTFTQEQITNLETISDQVLNALELRKRNIQKKESSEVAKQYDILFNASSDLICVLNERLEILNVNTASLDILGYHPYECKNLQISTFVLPADRQRVEELAVDYLSKGIKNFEVDTRIKTKDNTHKWINWNVVTKDRVWFVIGRDITKQKEVTKNLNQLSTVASKINNGVVISDAKSRVIWVNNAFSTITGFTLEDLGNKRLADVLIGKKTNKELIQKAREDNQRKKSFSIELLAYTKKGKQIWLSIHNTVILDSAGEVDSFIEVIIDITKKKQAEKQLQLLSLVASKTLNGVSICDHEGKVTWINEALENILGFSNSEVFGKYLGDLVKGDDADTSLLEIVRGKASKFEAYSIEQKVYKKDGSPIWLSISSTPVFDETRKVYNQIEIISDITERKETDMRLVSSKEEAWKLSKAKEMFLSVMSHEIRTPLNGIIGLSHILNDEEKLDSQKQSINLLKFSADNLLNLINDILDFSKIEVGKMTFENKRLDIRGLLNDIVSSLAFKTVNHEVKIHYHVADDVPALVRGDKTRTYQILINLLNNAIKFTSKGKINIYVALIENAGKVNIGFKVKDTGIGIPEDKLDAIFEPFTQAENNTARKYGGSGLGLSITQKLIKLFGGNISVTSEVGTGTQFSFNLNFNRFDGDLLADTAKERITKMKGKILVVDDNEINRLLATRVLSRYGLDVIATDNGLSAIELLQGKDFDLVLMDVHMPGLNGYETTIQLRKMEDQYYKSLPIIALTASVMDDHFEEIERCGMTDFQLKPFKPDELIEKIAKYIKVK